MTTYINQKSEFVNVEFDFKLVRNGMQKLYYGYYNSHSVEGAVKDQIYRIAEYLANEYPEKSFVTLFKDKKGLCCESRDGEVKAFIPVWDDANYDVVYKA